LVAPRPPETTSLKGRSSPGWTRRSVTKARGPFCRSGPSTQATFSVRSTATEQLLLICPDTTRVSGLGPFSWVTPVISATGVLQGGGGIGVAVGGGVGVAGAARPSWTGSCFSGAFELPEHAVRASASTSVISQDARAVTLPPGQLDPEAEVAEPRRDQVAMVTLDLDGPIAQGTAGRGRSLQC
jgi:hypothetical protein